MRLFIIALLFAISYAQTAPYNGYYGYNGYNPYAQGQPTVTYSNGLADTSSYTAAAAASTTNTPFALMGMHMWCGGETAESMLAGFMQHHKDVTDTEDPQTCANAVNADPECGTYFIMGSLYSFCLCVRKTAMCTFRTEIDFEDHGTDTRVYQITLPPSPGSTNPMIGVEPALKKTADSANEATTDSWSNDPLKLAFIGVGGVLAGVLSYFAASWACRKCVRSNEQTQVSLDRLI